MHACFKLALAACVAVSATTAMAQTADDPTPDLARALNHRLEKVRWAAFEALLMQAQNGQDVSAARDALLKYANLEYDKEDYRSQAAALKVLVAIDPEVAAKVVQRTEVLVAGVEALKARLNNSKKTSLNVQEQLRLAFSVLHCVTLPEHVRQTAGLARRRLKVENIYYASKYDHEVLLPLIYRGCSTAGECIETTRALEIELDDEGMPKLLLKGMYDAEIDQAGLDFLTSLPPKGNPSDWQPQVYLLGLLAPRSDAAKRAAVAFMNDKYEAEEVREAAAAGLLASATPDSEFYWSVVSVSEQFGGYYCYLDVGPKFDTESHRKLVDARREKEEAAKRAAAPPKPTASPAQPSADPQLPEQPAITREDSERYLKVFLSIRKKLRSEVIGGRIVPHVPLSAMKELKQAADDARNNGYPGTAHLLDETRESWMDAASRGTMVYVQE